MEDNSASVGQRWSLLHECCIQAVQLLAVQVRIERLVIGELLIVDDSMPIPPNTQKNLPGRQSRLGHRLGSLTAFRPRPFAHFSSPVTIRFKNGSILLRFRSDSHASIRAKMWYVRPTLYLLHHSRLWLNGYVNKQNCRFWSEDQLEELQKPPMHPKQVTVWLMVCGHHCTSSNCEW